MKNTMKSGTRMWKDVMEPNPQIQLDVTEFSEAEERKLAALLKPVDEQVYQLTVYMDGEDKLPTEHWFRRLFERFPWISGVMVYDRLGTVQFQHPMDFSKPVDAQALLALGQPKEGETVTGPDGNATAPEPWADHRLRALASDSPLGAEIFVAQPVFRDNRFEGLVVVHFDPRNLLKFCPTPEELMILTQKQVIWTSKYHDAAATMATLPWPDILASEVYGSMRVHDRDFFWLGRKLGHFSLIYATATPSDEQPAPGNATR